MEAKRLKDDVRNGRISVDQLTGLIVMPQRQLHKAQQRIKKLEDKLAGSPTLEIDEPFFVRAGEERQTGHASGQQNPARRSTGVDQWLLLRIFVMGEYRWRDENEWPPARTEFRSYDFRGDDAANMLNGDGCLDRDNPLLESPDRFLHDPENPVPTRGGEWRFLEPYGPLDQREIEKRADIPVDTSDVLGEALEVTGPAKVVPCNATDATDTDWTAKLVDVHPDARAFKLRQQAINIPIVTLLSVRIGYQSTLTPPAWKAASRLRLVTA